MEAIWTDLSAPAPMWGRPHGMLTRPGKQKTAFLAAKNASWIDDTPSPARIPYRLKTDFGIIERMRFEKYATSFLLISCTAMAGNVVWHTAPDKWQAPRLFHTPFDEQFASRILLDHCAILESLPERHSAPNGAYWFALMRPDHTNDGPWNSEVLVFTERDDLVRLRLRDIRDCHEVRWVNEKLLFIRVWWGRICATDLILDLEREQIIYREMVWDGTIPFQQFQDSKMKSH